MRCTPEPEVKPKKRSRDRMSKWDGFTSGKGEIPATEEEIRSARLRSVCKSLRSLAGELERAAADLEELGSSSQSPALVLGFSTRLAQDAIVLAELRGGL